MRPVTTRPARPAIWGLLLFSAATLAAACRSGPPKHVPASNSCGDRAAAALEDVRAVQREHGACQSPADCQVILFATNCFAACAWPIRRDGVDALTEAVREVQTETCKGHSESGCPLLAFPCPDTGQTRCVDGYCSL